MCQRAHTLVHTLRRIFGAVTPGTDHLLSEMVQSATREELHHALHADVYARPVKLLLQSALFVRICIFRYRE